MHFLSPIRLILIGLPSLLLVSCETTSPYSDQRVLELPEAYAADSTPPTTTLKDSLLVLFDHPALTEVVERALAHNPDMQRARARMEEAGFIREKSGAAKRPSLSANGNGGRQKRAQMPAADAYSASLDVRWEIDAWGKIAAGETAAEASEASAFSSYVAARQSLAAQTMQAWFQLVLAEQTLALDERRIASFASTQALVQRRFELGNGSLASVDLAKTDVLNARADAAASRDRRDQAARQIRVLCGEYPDANLSKNAWPALTAGVAEGLPSDLLLQRPDLMAAYQNVRAADARVKVAHADLFPSFALTGSAGQGSDTLSNLIKSGFDIWSIAGNISAPLFEAGRRKAERNAAEKRAEQAFYTYQRTVLTALREVENALGSETLLAREEVARQEALASARSATERSQRDYEAGLIDILSLLETQRRVFSTEQQTLNIKGARLSNRVALALALGKGA